MSAPPLEATALSQRLEGLIFAAEEPLNVEQMLALLRADSAEIERDQVRAALLELQQEYADKGIELREVATGFRFQVSAEAAPTVRKLFEGRTPRYSRALLETLAIIAYRQPVTRGDIESIRGVSVSTGIIKTLQEREWIKVTGYRDVPGRPAVYSTTPAFLDYFNLRGLDELPPLAELTDLETVSADLFNPPESTTSSDDDSTTAADATDADSTVGGEDAATESSSDDAQAAPR